MRHPYAELLSRVSKPGRYVGGEYNQVRKKPGAAEVEICLAFPDVYEIGMSHLGTRILYRLLNRHPGIACERAFTPWPDMEAELRSNALPLVSLENGRALAEFDVIGISLQYEMTYTNVLTLLDLAGIPLRAEKRDDQHPLVLGGGPTATHGEPIAPFFDLLFVGEAEDELADLLLDYKHLVRAGLPREQRLRRLVGAHPCLYAPSLYHLVEEPLTGALVVGAPRFPEVPPRVTRAVVADLAEHPFPDDFPVAKAEAVFDRVSIEVARGCTEGCRFCQAGMIYRPVRERAPREIVDTALAAIAKGGFDEVSLTALSTADYSAIGPLVQEMKERLQDEKVSLSVSSLRAYGLGDAVLDDIKSMRATGLTFAPEAGTQRMRDVINKNISDDDLLETARRVFAKGWRRMKLYFMIGLPTEEDADVEGIVDTAGAMRRVGRRLPGAGGVEVTISVSSHVPKPHTPFQWAAMDSVDEIERKQELLRTRARGARLKIKQHDSRVSFLEGIAARGDRRVADAIELAWSRGCRFDGWSECLRFDLWSEAIRDTDLPVERYLGTIPTDARLPWDHIDLSLEPGFLAKEYRKALRGRLSPPCGKPARAQVHHSNVVDHQADKRTLVCYDCGVACDLTKMRDERLDFLRSMEAWRPRQTAPPDAADEERKAARRRRIPAAALSPPPPGYRYRLRYSKLSAARFLGHLDTLRALPRVFRRAGIGVNYSQGFHPHPLLSFGPALPLGWATLGDLVEVVLACEHPPDELRTKLNAAAPQGLEVGALRLVGAGEAKLNRRLATADLVVALPPEPVLRAAGGFSELARRCAELSAATAVPIVRRDKRGRDKSRDLAELIERVAPARAAALDPRLELDPGALVLAMHLRLDRGWAAQAREILTSLGLGEIEGFGCARLGCWAETQGRRIDPLSGEPVAQPWAPAEEGDFGAASLPGRAGRPNL